MAEKLDSIPLKQREVLFVVKDDREKALCFLKKLDCETGLNNCRLATEEEARSAFPECADVTSGDLMVWDDFSEKYIPGDKLAEAGWQRAQALLRFCRDFLGAVEGDVHYEEKKRKGKRGHWDIDVDGKYQHPVGEDTGKGDKTAGKEISVGGKFGFESDRSDEMEQEGGYGEHFKIDTPLPFDLKKAQAQFDKMNYGRFEEFNTFLDFRRNFPGKGTHEFELMFFKSLDKKLKVAVDFELKLAEMLDLKIRVQRDSEVHDLAKMALKCKVVYG